MIPFLISIPKAGTHIFRQASGKKFTNIPYGSMIYESDPHYQAIIDIKIAHTLGIGHLPYHPEYEQLLHNIKAKVVFLYRDPRDLMVSYYFWIRKLGHKGSSIPGLIDDVGTILNSENPWKTMIQFWGAHIRRYLPWMFSPHVLSVKYEQLVGESALETFDEIARFWGKAFGEGQAMLERLDPGHCVTFRKGIVGDWKNHFDLDDMEMFMKELGPVLEFWGYV